jgi:PAS domain S-box-containing protein
LVLAAVLVAGTTLSLLAGRLLKETELLREREQRSAAMQSVLGALDLELTRTVEAVRGAGLMVESQQDLTHDEFAHYAQRALVNLSSINFLEWQPIVAATELARFEARARAAGQPRYRVIEPNTDRTGWQPVQGRGEYVPVLYCWPEHFATAGYDMSFSPERMDSKQKSAMLGQPVASGVFNIMKEGHVASGTPGIAISSAVYRADRSVQGYVAAVVDLPTLFQDASMRADAAKLDMLVYDLNTPGDKPLFTALGGDSDLTPAQTGARVSRPGDQATTVDFARQAWEVVLHPRPQFAAVPLLRYSTGASLAGLLATVALTLALARAQASRRALQRAQVATQQARESLTVQRQRLQNIIEATDVGTWEFNFVTGEVQVNDRWAAIGGMTQAQWRAIPNYTWQWSCHPDDIPMVEDALRRHARGQSPSVETEYRHRHSDGHWVWVALKGKMLSRTPEGKPGVFAGSIAEITERKAAQARIEELNATLEQRVQERTAQLERANAHLRRSQEELSKSEARATLGTLVAGVSHEISTPLGNSMMTASTLADQARDFDRLQAAGQLRRSDLARFVTQVHEGNALMLRNLERAVDLLKNFRQVAADQASEQRRSFDLRQAIQEIIDTLAPSLKHQPHHLVQDIPADIAMDSYPGPLGQVVINLVNNAYLHAFDGMAQGTFTIHAQADAHTATLTFADNGKGIAADTLARMFEPFFSTKIGRGGTGLGMSIVENLVTKTLGGQLKVQSTLGVGTTIVVTLPRQAPHPTVEPA